MPDGTQRTLLAATVVFGLLLAGCASPPERAAPETTTEPSPHPTTSSSPPPPPPEQVGANELGRVPILMYHRITNEPTTVYDRTPRGFRAELRRLAKENYVPVTTSEYATGRMDIPAGKHPVVLTFDDASTTQFALNQAGEPKANTAVSILLEVAERHPGFRPVASFYISAPPFGGSKVTESLRWLHDHGFELGNHTVDHPRLDEKSAAGAQGQIAGMQRTITNAVPDARVTTIALPHGIHPANERLAISGRADGVEYEHDAVLLVGARPASSPYSGDFDPLNVPRIRSQSGSGESARFGSTVWLDKLAANPDTRYTSDGDPGRISYPSNSSTEPTNSHGQKVRAY